MTFLVFLLMVAIPTVSAFQLIVSPVFFEIQLPKKF